MDNMERMSSKFVFTSVQKGDLGAGRRNSRPAAVHRLSLVANTSPTFPRSHSPISASPLDSPRVHSPCLNFSFAPIKRYVVGNFVY